MIKIKRMHFMTRLEWITKTRPECVNEYYGGGVRYCPFDYGFTDCDDREPSESCLSFQGERNKPCEKCWSKPAIVNGKYILVRKDK